jgi:hypothetical protein
MRSPCPCPWIVPAVCLALALPAAALAQPWAAVRGAPKQGAIEAGAPRTTATCTMSQPIACGQTVAGSLNMMDCMLPDGTAVVYYTFSGTAGEAVTATLTSSDFAPLIELMDPSGHVKTANSSAQPGSAQIQLTLDATGTWTLAANNNANMFQAGAFTLGLTCATPKCPFNGATLCLQDGRFSVTASFDAGGGDAGIAQAVALTTDTGYLWFFAAANVEAVVKVLDACAFNGKFWVFAGGLTNVAVTMTVTDTQTGTQKMYQNPANTAFQPIQDTSAFSTCP